MKRIRVTQGDKLFYALVDDEDFNYLNQYSWWLRDCKTSMYAMTKIDNAPVSMHSLLIREIPIGHTIDHKNTNGLDNQKHNLRIATLSQQQINRNIQDNNTSGYKGTSWNKCKKKWRAYITVKGIQLHLGYFNTLNSAAEAYNEAAIKHYDDFANLNIIERAG